ncbi:SMC family ATPase [uncultured Vibrio sp.]|uniref:AAA family ATPase n=1 Tax=uncultured Vibrio sp. TaxID=114054 RepID=UPI0025FA1087|nr:SMC family ATPase [uncultured Vibrio sp.]
MQPLKLTLQAFGPFASAQSIDFTSMGNAPLFLINGPTGSGKSSILDAICYALYGETTGSERTGDQMRCDYAEGSLLTEVSFEFKLFDRSYKVERAPEQEVPKKRGEGTTKRAHTATLYQLDNESETLLANKPAPVIKAVRDLIGLDVKQFRQVMVLPQGKFRELLTANSKEREQIFGQLFQTHIYTAIERALFEKASGIRKAKDEFDNQTKGVLDVANVEDESQLNERLEDNGARLSEASDALSKLSKALEEAQLSEKSAKELAERFQQLELKKTQFKQHIDGEEKIVQLVLKRESAIKAQSLDVTHSKFQSSQNELNAKSGAIQQVKAALEKAEIELTDAKTQLESAQKESGQLPEHQNRLFFLESIKAKFQERAQFSAMLNQAQTEGQRALAQRDLLQSGVIKLETQLNETRTQLDSAKFNYQQLPLVRQQQVTLLEQLELENKKRQLLQTLKEQSLYREAVEKKLAVAKEQTSIAIAYADNLEYQWHSSQAAQLAKQLQLDEPCPVCGSCDHPEPAQFAVEEVTKQNVDVARAHQQEIKNIEQKAVETLSQADNQLALTQQAIANIEEQLEGKDKLSIEDIHGHLATLKQQIIELEKAAPDKIEHSLAQLDQKLLETKAQLQTHLDSVSTSQVLIAQHQTEVDSRSKDIPEEFHDLSLIESQILNLTALIESVTNKEQMARTKFEQSQQRVASENARNSELEDQKKSAQSAFAECEERWTADLKVSPFIDEQAYLLSRLTNSEIGELDRTINEFEQLKTKLAAEVTTLESSVANKTVPDWHKLSELRLSVENEYNESLKGFTQLQSTQDRYNEVLRKLKVLSKQNETLSEEYKVVGTLSDVANGKTGSKISLHRFVLGVLLDDVLIQASIRLRKMSKGRYELKRKEHRAKGNVGSGLDLMVEDGYTSKLRDVATLSGGESFMAALALALGLSDVVQSYSGGIRLDTLFIDEGFGSLDPESLDLAIETLIDLQLGGRTIGIISHVSELKEQMSLRIDVEPSRKGSEIAVIH